SRSLFFFFSSRRRHTRWPRDWSSDVCSSDLRDKINQNLQKIIDEQTEPWGIKVAVVEIKDVELPSTMQRAMAKQAEAEREKRAKIINADGEFQASQTLANAAQVISSQQGALQLRFLQTMVEIGSEKNTTVILPLPIELFKP